MKKKELFTEEQKEWIRKEINMAVSTHVNVFHIFKTDLSDVDFSGMEMRNSVKLIPTIDDLKELKIPAKEPESEFKEGELVWGSNDKKRWFVGQYLQYEDEKHALITCVGLIETNKGDDMPGVALFKYCKKWEE